MTRGFSLPELVVALLVLAVLLHAGTGVLAELTDRWAVLAAREEAAALIGLARSRAVGAGSELTFDEDRDLLQLVAGGDTVLRPAGPEGVRLEVVGRASVHVLRFDALGLGKVGSRRLRFRRGRAISELVVSSYGRVRRP